MKGVLATLVLTCVGGGVAAAAGVEPARADVVATDPCVRRDDDGEPYPVCFDLGNRFLLTAGTDGVGGEIALRHFVGTVDPTVTWRFEHRILPVLVEVDALGGDREVRATLYQARYLRHSRDGHLMLPSSPPKRIVLPFDVGVDVTVLGVTGRLGSSAAAVRVIRAGLFADLARSADWRRRLAIGTNVRWDADVADAPRDFTGHRVVPFSTAYVDAAIESRDGLWRLGLRAEAGAAWSSDGGWGGFVETEAGIERVLVAVNDWPFSLYVAGAWSEPGEVRVAAGLRVSPLVSTRSPSRSR